MFADCRRHKGQQPRGDRRVPFRRQMQSVRLKVLSSPHVHVRDDDGLDMACTQPANDGSHVRRMLSHQSVFKIVGRCLVEYDEPSSVRNRAVEARQHSGGGIAVDAGVDHMDAVALGPKHSLELSRKGSFGPHPFSGRVAGA